MKHHGTFEIVTARLTLLPFRPDDAPAMFANWASDPEVTKYLTWPTHSSVEVSRMICSDWASRYDRDDYYNWAIWLDEVNEPIGSISVVNQDDKVGKAEIGYCIGRAWWGQGIVAEALNAVMDFLFDNEGYQRIEARHDPRNPNSGAVMRKCGMKYEGTMRQSDWNNQGICDACWYALLRDER
ncbi:MAG: GNAT family N-acetyltransferase [Clostridia bacterium]|nr:GNAT family N-acetyltransferase [Clostridia bacterium]